MHLTPHQAKYIAHDLTLQHAGGGLDRLSQALFNASVDLNPHQIEAAVFALRSPLSKGVLLADAVGLGKTIEAGIALCQYWAERKRQLFALQGTVAYDMGPAQSLDHVIDDEDEIRRFHARNAWAEVYGGWTKEDEAASLAA